MSLTKRALAEPARELVPYVVAQVGGAIVGALVLFMIASGAPGPALIAGSWAMGQLWLFWLAPIVGAVIAGVVYQLVGGRAVEWPTEGMRAPVTTTPSERLEPAHGSTW